MKVAEARYVGRQRSKNMPLPSGDRIHLRRNTEGPVWAPVESAEDAEHLAEQMNVEVRWKPLGRLKAASDGALSVLSEWSYRQKQKAVDEFGLEIAKNSPEEDLEAALQEHVEELHDEGDL